MDFSTFAQYASKFLDAAGVCIILGGVIIASLAVLVKAFEQRSIHNLYLFYRQNMARSILIGLEFLVAGDIIRSVAGDFNPASLLTLAVIVAIRTFLSIEFDMEIEGRWPWKRSKKAQG
ncbi:MAG: DUF1622 domain-containing protein [Candidatus Woesebacteria bacterium]|jgi:uncharacterized membrane protein